MDPGTTPKLRNIDGPDLQRVRGGQLEPAAASPPGTGKTLTAALLGKTP